MTPRLVKYENCGVICPKKWNKKKFKKLLAKVEYYYVLMSVST